MTRLAPVTLCLAICSGCSGSPESTPTEQPAFPQTMSVAAAGVNYTFNCWFAMSGTWRGALGGPVLDASTGMADLCTNWPVTYPRITLAVLLADPHRPPEASYDLSLDLTTSRARVLLDLSLQVSLPPGMTPPSAQYASATESGAAVTGTSGTIRVSPAELDAGTGIPTAHRVELIDVRLQATNVSSPSTLPFPETVTVNAILLYKPPQ